MIAALTALAFVPVAPLIGDTLSYEVLIPAQSTDWNELVAVPQFDPSTGTLNFVTMRLSASFEASMLAENWSDDPVLITAALTETITVTPLAELPSLSVNASIDESTQAVGPHDDQPLGGDDTAAWTLGLATISDERIYIDVDCAPFIGQGAVDFQAAAVADFWISSNTGNLLTVVSSQAGLMLEVTYDYVPEPATLWLLLLGLGAIRRRRGIRPQRLCQVGASSGVA